MSANPIEAQVLDVLRDLSTIRQAEILDFALFLRERERGRAISNEDAAEVNGTAPQDTPYGDDPLERFIGAFDSGGLNWADEHDRYIGEAILRDMQGDTADNDSR